MRPFIALLVICAPCAAFADPGLELVGPSAMSSDNGGFRLGGAAARAAIMPTAPINEHERQSAPRLSLPLGPVPDEFSRTESDIGPATVFISEGLDAGRDSLELGTFLRRGQTRAGLSVTYLETGTQLARSELFVDYALSEQFSVGLSGILDAERSDEEPLRQLGLNAEYATSGGAFVQGGVAGATDYDPVIGISIGLRF